MSLRNHNDYTFTNDPSTVKITSVTLSEGHWFDPGSSHSFFFWLFLLRGVSSDDLEQDFGRKMSSLIVVMLIITIPQKFRTYMWVLRNLLCLRGQC